MVSMNRFAKVAFLIVAVVVPTVIAQPPPVEIPAAIKVPDGHKLVACFEAKGVQVYEAVKGNAGDLEWKFKAPLAVLSDGKNGKVGTHSIELPRKAAAGGKVVKRANRKAIPF